MNKKVPLCHPEPRGQVCYVPGAEKVIPHLYPAPVQALLNCSLQFRATHFKEDVNKQERAQRGAASFPSGRANRTCTGRLKELES